MISVSSFKAIFFDAGGTLLHPYPSVGEIYSDVGSRYGSAVNAETLQKLFHDAWLKRDGLTSLVSHSNPKVERKWWHELVKEVFEAAGWKGDFEPFFEHLYELFGRPEVWRLYPGTLEVLATLKTGGAVMGVISNWDARLLELCSGLGLHRYFDFVLASAVVGAAKPHGSIFEQALAQAGVRPEEAVHIGDSLEDDVRGAQAAGLQAVLINRHPERREYHGEQLKDVHVIRDLWELVES